MSWTSNKRVNTGLKFEDHVSEVEKSSVEIIQKYHYQFSFFGGGGNHKAQNYRDTVADLAKSYKDVGCNMSLRVHFLDSHLDLLLENTGALNDEHG